jgi:hypothetical protein
MLYLKTAKFQVVMWQVQSIYYANEGVLPSVRDRDCYVIIRKILDYI